MTKNFGQYNNVKIGETKAAKRKLQGAGGGGGDVNADNLVISKLVQPKTNSKYFIHYLDKVMRPLVLILPKKSGCIKIFIVKDGDKDKNNKCKKI